ncbi:MAG: LysM domain-containing protein [Limisphaerales bacterium]
MRPQLQNRRPPKPRTYTIAARDTVAAIARKYNVSVNALLAANPGLNPKKTARGARLLNFRRLDCCMSSRLLFLIIAAFWVHHEFFYCGAQSIPHTAAGEPVPVDLVWRKILTAPDSSSLSIYQHGERSGFCEFKTSVEMEMANLDEDKFATRRRLQPRGLPDPPERQHQPGRLHQPAPV